MTRKGETRKGDGETRKGDRFILKMCATTNNKSVTFSPLGTVRHKSCGGIMFVFFSVRARWMTIPVLAASMVGCAFGPSSDWVARDKESGKGRYEWADGRSYVGGFNGDAFEGVGTLSWPPEDPNELRSYPFQLYGGRLTIHWKNDKYLVDKAARYEARNGAFVYEGGFGEGDYNDGGFNGHGVLTYPNGFRIEGEFANEPTLFDYFRNHRMAYGENHLIGSKARGQVRASAADGSVFVGTIVDYYPFSREMGTTVCSGEGYFAGIGKLTRPDKPDYFGPVRGEKENSVLVPTTKDAVEDAATYVAECPYRLRAERDSELGKQRRQDAELAQARKEANQWLAGEIAAMPGRMKSEMAAIEMASRGTSPEIEAAKAQRAAAVQRAMDQMSAQGVSQASTSSQGSSGSTVSSTSTGAGEAKKAGGCYYLINENAGTAMQSEADRERNRQEIREQNRKAMASGLPKCQEASPTGPGRNSSR